MACNRTGTLELLADATTVVQTITGVSAPLAYSDLLAQLKGNAAAMTTVTTANVTEHTLVGVAGCVCIVRFTLDPEVCDPRECNAPECSEFSKITVKKG